MVQDHAENEEEGNDFGICHIELLYDFSRRSATFRGYGRCVVLRHGYYLIFSLFSCLVCNCPDTRCIRARPSISASLQGQPSIYTLIRFLQACSIKKENYPSVLRLIDRPASRFDETRAFQFSVLLFWFGGSKQQQSSFSERGRSTRAQTTLDLDRFATEVFSFGKENSVRRGSHYLENNHSSRYLMHDRAWAIKSAQGKKRDNSYSLGDISAVRWRVRKESWQENHETHEFYGSSSFVGKVNR